MQASVNSARTLLGFVTKNLDNDENSADELWVYNVYMLCLKDKTIFDFKFERSKQIIIQFLYKKQSVLADKNPSEKFLLLIHHECKKSFRFGYFEVL